MILTIFHSPRDSQDDKIYLEHYLLIICQYINISNLIMNDIISQEKMR